MARYTRVAAELFDWPPWQAMSYTARSLWMGLYASAEAKTLLPGLFRGGLGVMAEAARMPPIDAQSALRELVERGLALQDEAHRLTLLTALPDRGERASNGKVLRMWWNRWLDLPESPLKERWVGLLEWLLAPMTADHKRVWEGTFSSVTTVTVELRSELRIPLKGTTAPGYDAGQLSMFPNNSGRADTVSDTVSDTVRCTVSGSSGKRGVRGERRRSEHPFSIGDLFGALTAEARGRIATDPWDERMARPVWAVIEQCEKRGVTLEDVRLAGAWIGAGGLSYRDDLGIGWIARTGALLEAVAKARLWQQAGRPAMCADRAPLRGSARRMAEPRAWTDYADGEVRDF